MAVVALSALAAACVQATTGLGFAFVLGPALFALLDPEPAIVALTALGIAMNVLPSRAWTARHYEPLLLGVIAAAGVVSGATGL